MKIAQAAIAIDQATSVSHRGTYLAACFTVLIDVSRSTPLIDCLNLRTSVITYRVAITAGNSSSHQAPCTARCQKIIATAPIETSEPAKVNHSANSIP